MYNNYNNSNNSYLKYLLKILNPYLHPPNNNKHPPLTLKEMNKKIKS